MHTIRRRCGSIVHAPIGTAIPSYHHIPSDGDAMMEWGSLVFWMRGVGIGYRVFRDEGGDGDWISIFFMRGGGDDFVPYEG